MQFSSQSITLLELLKTKVVDTKTMTIKLTTNKPCGLGGLSGELPMLWTTNEHGGAKPCRLWTSAPAERNAFHKATGVVANQTWRRLQDCEAGSW